MWGKLPLDSRFCAEGRNQGGEFLSSYFTVGGGGHMPWGQGSGEGPLRLWKGPKKLEIPR